MEGVSCGQFYTPPAKEKREPRAHNPLLILSAEGVTKRPRAATSIFTFSFFIFYFYFLFLRYPTVLKLNITDSLHKSDFTPLLSNLTNHSPQHMFHYNTVAS